MFNSSRFIDLIADGPIPKDSLTRIIMICIIVCFGLLKCIYASCNKDIFVFIINICISYFVVYMYLRF